LPDGKTGKEENAAGPLCRFLIETLFHLEQKDEAARQ
jgi:hypothetical protein